MTETERYLKSFIQDLENDCKTMQSTLLNYEGRCDQLRIDISRMRTAIKNGKEAIEKIKEVKSND